MPTIRRPIVSSAKPESSRPWAKLSFDTATLRATIEEFNGLGDEAKEAAILGVKQLALTPLKLAEPHALYIDLAGALRFAAFSDLPQVCYAHLAFWYPATATLELLDFIDDPTLT